MLTKKSPPFRAHCCSIPAAYTYIPQDKHFIIHLPTDDTRPIVLYYRDTYLYKTTILTSFNEPPCILRTRIFCSALNCREIHLVL